MGKGVWFKSWLLPFPASKSGASHHISEPWSAPLVWTPAGTRRGVCPCEYWACFQQLTRLCALVGYHACVGGQGGLPWWLSSKESACNAGDLVRSLGWEGPLKEGTATCSQYSCLEISMDRRAWQATVHGVAKSRT